MSDDAVRLAERVIELDDKWDIIGDHNRDPIHTTPHHDCALAAPVIARAFLASETARKEAEERAARVDRVIGYPQQHLDALDVMTERARKAERRCAAMREALRLIRNTSADPERESWEIADNALSKDSAAGLSKYEEMADCREWNINPPNRITAPPAAKDAVISAVKELRHHLRRSLDVGPLSNSPAKEARLWRKIDAAIADFDRAALDAAKETPT